VEEAFKTCRLPMIVEDAGLFIDALNGFPGVRRICVQNDWKPRHAQVNAWFCRQGSPFESAIAYLLRKQNTDLLVGQIDGEIALKNEKAMASLVSVSTLFFNPVQRQDFRWDVHTWEKPVFTPAELSETSQNGTFTNNLFDGFLEKNTSAREVLSQTQTGWNTLPVTKRIPMQPGEDLRAGPNSRLRVVLRVHRTLPSWQFIIIGMLRSSSAAILYSSRKMEICIPDCLR